MSPDQAAARLALEGGLQISHETIYRYIYADQGRGGELWRHLRCQKPRRKRYASGQERRGAIRAMPQSRAIQEDWEGGFSQGAYQLFHHFRGEGMTTR